MKIFTGKVVSTKMPKTACVSVDRVFVHPVYKKRFRRIKKYFVHDDIGVSEGDIVNFSDSRPYSKTKKWKILEVVRKDKKDGTAKK